jgi:hypothetical protein
MKGLIYFILLTLVLAVIMPLAAQAADPQYCQAYAAAAIKNLSIARAKPGCVDLWGPRWSPDYQFHYAWCTLAPVSTADYETAARAAYARTCR